MANNNNYNYYKSEYGKFKENYYTPGNNNKNNKNKSNKSVKRFFRAFLVFLITFSIIAAVIFGGYKLFKMISANKEDETTVVTTTQKAEEKITFEEKTTIEKTTEEKTTAEKTTEEKTTENKISSSGISAGAVGYIKTSSGDGIFLRHNPTYDEAGFTPLKDGTKIVIAKISDDGKWAKTSNFDINGWVYLDYVDGLATTASVKTDANSINSKGTTYPNNISFDDALGYFEKDTSHNVYLNCKISGSDVKGIANYQNPSSKVVKTFSNNQSVAIYSVREGYGKTRVNDKEVWIPTSNLEFVSWGYYNY